MTPEQKSTQVVRIRATAWGSRLFRNNSGVLMNPAKIPVRFGLGNESKKLNKKIKSSDLIGITPIEITPEMVGKTVGVFTAYEVKPVGFKKRETYSEKSREFGQNNFINLIKKFGGIAGFTTNDYDVDLAVHEFKEGLK